MILTIVSIILSLFCSTNAQDIPNKLGTAKQKLLYEGNIVASKKELLSIFSLANKSKGSENEKVMKTVLDLLGEYAGVPYRELFKMCRTSGIDCSYYKAKILEMQGNAGSAMELYLEAGYYEDYLRLRAYSGEGLNEVAKKYGINEDIVSYYQGLFYVAKGEWENAIRILSNDNLKSNAKAIFYLGYALLMKGDNEKVNSLVHGQSGKINYFEKLEYKRLKGLLLYAENKQFEAFDILKEILAVTPDDLLSKRYIAHMYYRTGWFSKAEKIYSDLINKEWRDTELYYLLSERSEMRVRNLKFDTANKDAERIVKEYPSRKDFVVGHIALLLSYGNSVDADSFLNYLSAKDSTYEQGLRFFAQGLILEFNRDYVGASTAFKNAMQVFPSPEYNAKVIQSEQNLKEMNINRAPKLSCGNYNVKRLSTTVSEVSLKKTGDEPASRYYVSKTSDGLYSVRLPLMFVYDSRRIYFNDKKALWADKVQKVWSVDGLKVTVDYSDKNKPVKVDVVPWPSSFYLKRVSSHEWSVLTPPSVIAHEVGHLLGLDDEYYELDPRVLERNKGRYIGPMSSIMRNMYNGKPEKRHIHFILSPLKCD